MRQILCCFFILGLSYLSFSQKVSGIVTDSDGKPIPFASVYLKGTTKGTNANNEGKYFLELDPGQYTLVCQHINYRMEEKVIVCGVNDIVVNFKLVVQEVILDDVTVTNTTKREDPAYEIIRNTIKKRTYHLGQMDKFQCEVYTKGQLKVRSYPKRLFGRKVNLEDGDTSKQKMLYLSETIAKYSVNKPQKVKIEVISTRVSGQSDAYGLSAPNIYSFYENNVSIGTRLNPRGFISPISDNALNYYKYKYEGEFEEGGRQILKIKVTPRRKYEPLFTGYINIVENEWRIYSVDLFLTKESQMEFIDSLKIEQLYRPVKGDVWAIGSQVIYPSANILGFDAHGSFINIYSNFDIEPQFDKKFFTPTILKYTDSSNKKDAVYWDTTRPVPLMSDEISDYKRKDSLEKDPRHRDSITRADNKVNMFGALLFEQTMVTKSRRMSFTFRPLSEQFSFNCVEGLVINTGAIWTNRFDSSANGKRRSISLAPNLRYGFSNKHFNAHLTFTYRWGRNNPSVITLSGGKRIFQFNNNSPIGPRGNTISSLLGEKNRLKIYEAWYVRGSYNKGVGSGFSWTAAFQYQDRMPLDNTTDYTWVDKKGREYTPNYPNELVSENIKRHQVFFALVGLNWQPGARYIDLPNERINLGSKAPKLSLQYLRNFSNIFGSDGDFSRWKFSMSDEVNLKLFGKLGYRIGVGGFIDNDLVQIPDYQHFNGNLSTLATEYLNSFQLLPLYLYSNTSRFFSLAHIEHNFHGLLTNKIPVVRKLNVYLVVGGNGFYMNRTDNYFELFAGIDNIFKRFRIDIVNAFKDGRFWKSAIRIGLTRLGETRGDDWP